MADKIKISPSELMEQHERLVKIGKDFVDIKDKAQRALNLMDGALSGKFANNMRAKKGKLISNIGDLIVSLTQGAIVAQKCAESFENADRELRDIFGNDLPDEIRNSDVSEQKVQQGIESSIHYSQLADKDKVGKVITDTSENYYVKYEGKLQCVGYARGRFYELTNHKLNIYGDAIKFKDKYVNDSCVYYTTNIYEIKLPAIAVTKGITSDGHVVVIENLDYDDKGNITKIYFTEGNSEGANGTLKVKFYSEFFKDGQYLKPYGFISLK